jgi:LysM repeat protein
LSRILGLVLVVVLAGVFSFVAYRKYDEARRNPQSLENVADADGTPASSDAPTDPATPKTADQPNITPTPIAASPTATEKPVATASSDAFGSLEEPSPNQAPSGHHHLGQEGQPSNPAASLAQAAPSPKTAPTHETDANPFGDAGGSPAGRAQPSPSPQNAAQPNPWEQNQRQQNTAQQPPSQGEPPQEVAAATPATPSQAYSPFKSNGAAAPANAGQNLAAAGGPAGTPQASGNPRSAPANGGADADMQNLFPGENAAKPAPPVAEARKAEMPEGAGHDPIPFNRPNPVPGAPTQLAQSKAPPTQSEPMDTALDEPHRPAAHPLADDRGVAGLDNEARTTKHDPSTGTRSAAAPDRTALANQDHTPFDANEPTPAKTNSRPVEIIPGRSSARELHATSVTTVRPAERPSPASSGDETFASNRPGGANSGGSAAVEVSATHSSQMAAGSATISAVGSTGDAGDYYVVQPTDNFWTVSRKKYGTPRYFLALAELNKARIPDPARMRPGMKVSTPSAEMLEERFGQFLPAGTRVQAASAEDISAKSAPTGFFVAPDGSPKYRTGESDTLSEIAAKHLGRSSRWIQIFEMNRDKLSSPNQLKVGTELTLPGDASNVAVSSEEDERR